MSNRHWMNGLIWSVAGAVFLMMGCGGGGGGGNDLGYDGSREAAEISCDNCQDLAASAYGSYHLEGPFGSFASLNDAAAHGADAHGAAAPGAGSLGGRPALWSISQTLIAAADAVRLEEAEAVSSARALGGDGSMSVTGSCGGEADIRISTNEALGVFVGDFDFKQYCNDGTALQGQASFEGRTDPDSGQLEFFTFNFSNLVGTAEDESFRLDGALTLRTAAESTTIDMELLFENAVAGETVWFNDFVISVTDGVDAGQPYQELTFSGRIYHPEHGYADVRTDVPFRFEMDADHPGEGVLILTGSEDATIVMSVLSDDQYQLEGDMDGDGEYDCGPEVYDWED